MRLWAVRHQGTEIFIYFVREILCVSDFISMKDPMDLDFYILLYCGMLRILDQVLIFREIPLILDLKILILKKKIQNSLVHPNCQALLWDHVDPGS